MNSGICFISQRLARFATELLQGLGQATVKPISEPGADGICQFFSI